MFVLTAGCLIGSGHAASPRVCELEKTRTGLTSYAVDGERAQDGTREISDIDIDRDGINDKISWFCPGSGSIIPADSCTVAVKLSSVDKKLTLEEQRLYIAKYQSTFYVVAGRVETEKGPWHSSVYQIGPKKISRICSFSGKGIGR
jgi:hypothetical protein